MSSMQTDQLVKYKRPSPTTWTLFWRRRLNKGAPFATNLPKRFLIRLRKQSSPPRKSKKNLWRQATHMSPSLQAVIQFLPKSHSFQPSYQLQKLIPKLRQKLVHLQHRKRRSKFHRRFRGQTQACQRARLPRLLYLCSSATILIMISSQYWSSSGKVFRRSTATRWRWSLEMCVFREKSSLKTKLLYNASS